MILTLQVCVFLCSDHLFLRNITIRSTQTHVQRVKGDNGNYRYVLSHAGQWTYVGRVRKAARGEKQI